VRWKSGLVLLLAARWQRSVRGININGGGWVQKSDPVDTVLETCIFPDMSSIDSWGLTYNQFGTLRGNNLDKVVRYPNLFGN
jgi:hypothetical protein